MSTEEASTTEPVSPARDVATGGESPADLVGLLDRQRKMLDRILNATMVSSNVAREVRAESNAAADGLKGVVTELVQAGERRDAKIHSTFDAFQRAFREEIATLRGSISTVLREQAFLEMASSWMSVLDDIDALGRLSNEKGAGAWTTALQTLANRIVSILDANGLSALPVTPGETRFDPELHEAAPPATSQEIEEIQKGSPGTIMFVHSRGFQYGKRLHRCARVVVAPARETAATAEKEQ